VAPDELDISEVQMQATVNGEVWSEGALGAIEHSFVEIIEHMSQNLYLHPGTCSVAEPPGWDVASKWTDTSVGVTWLNSTLRVSECFETVSASPSHNAAGRREFFSE
jgi:hypothetical protein